MALEAKALFLTTVADEGTVLETSTIADATMDGSNLLRQQPTDRFRSTVIANTYAEIDLGQSLSMDFVTIMFTNVSSTAVWRYRIASSQANLTASPVYDSRTYWPSDKECWHSNTAMDTAAVDLSSWQRTHAFHDIEGDVGSAVTNRYVRIDVYDSSNQDGYIDIGRFYTGLKYQPGWNINWGSGMPFHAEEPQRIRMEGGLKVAIGRPREGVMEFTLGFKTEDELMTNFFEMNRLRGTSGDILFMLDPTSKWAHHFMVYGLFAQPVFSSIPEYSHWEIGARIEGML
jgi:hypothetical protein